MHTWNRFLIVNGFVQYEPSLHWATADCGASKYFGTQSIFFESVCIDYVPTTAVQSPCKIFSDCVGTGKVETGEPVTVVCSPTINGTTGWYKKFIYVSPSLPAGTYRYSYSAMANYQTDNRVLWIQMVVDGVLKDQLNIRGDAGATYANTHGVKYQSFGSTQTHTFVMEVAKETSNDAWVKAGYLEIWRVS